MKWLSKDEVWEIVIISAAVGIALLVLFGSAIH